MPYNGQLNQNVNYVFRIADAGNGTAVTFLSINKLERVAGVQPEKVTAGSSKDFAQTFSSKIDRVMLYLNLATAAGQVTVTVLDGNGNTVQAPVTYTGDQTVVWDTSLL